ncbi:MAG: hypothetical protein IT368_04715, partial [Candidatus Hydrogenedentes bacterium]|nr:hypothetical protein [Candidatus Hydrogenedentota bacterium]
MGFSPATLSFGFRRLCALSSTILLAGCALSADVSTTSVAVTDEVVVEGPPRFGMNIGESTYYNDQQVVANPLTYGDFPKGRQTLQIRVGKSTGNTITDTYFDPADPDRSYSESFAGGTYYIATGARAGESGMITDHNLDTGTYTLEHNGEPLAENDVVWLKGVVVSRGLPDAPNEEPGLGIGDWRMVARDGVTVNFVDDPDEPGDQLLQISFPPAGERLSGGTTHYIKATPGTTYRLRIRARSELQEASIGVRFSHLGMEDGGPDAEVDMQPKGDTILTPEWREYVFEGTSAHVDEVASKFSSITIGTAVTTSATNAGAVYIDSIDFEDEKLGSPSG